MELTMNAKDVLAKRNEPEGIPIAEQAAAILNAQTNELAVKYCDGNLRQLDERWTITISDLLRYVKKNGIPNGWLHTRPATYDGIYMLQSKTMWMVYEQERGGIYPDSKRSFESYDQALEHVLQTYYMPKSSRLETLDS
jgi:hypothetical protein